ncbi:flavin reductase family protein [Qipengyuania sp. DGS5-3]|uniref:flavin reductase family protein n=1 Tax=Qipengyuania sp. DGS5-3 TaxID=3349632 RepID=UPI0036D2BC32
MSLVRADSRQFRDALGSFATGVTIATTTGPDDEPIGVTASSFNSVSIDPPLVLWSLAKSSLSRPAFCESGHFAVHVLSADQDDLADRFARTGEDKFGDLTWTKGELGSPVLDHYAAKFECRTQHQYDGGDHIIMVGEVVGFETRDKAPLLFHGGRYGDHRPRREAMSETGREEENLFALIAKAHALMAERMSAEDREASSPMSLAEMREAEESLRRVIERLERVSAKRA